MGTYRVEEASTGRAGCQNKECKDQRVKIQKGELRFGSWVENEKYQSFTWKHWGCVTPKQFGNIIQSLEDAGMDAKDLDGFEELSEENQEKIVKAVEAGHVDDADWKGDVEMNRPGKSGFRVRGGAKKDATAASEADEPEEEKPKQTKSKKRAAKADEDEDEAPSVKKNKKGSRAKKAAGAEEDEEEDVAGTEEEKPAPKKTRATRASTAGKSEKPARRTRQKKQAAEDEDGRDGEGQSDDELVEEKPKRGGRKRAAKSG